MIEETYSGCECVILPLVEQVGLKRKAFFQSVVWFGCGGFVVVLFPINFLLDA